MSEVWRWKPPKYTCPNCGKAPQSHLGRGPSPIKRLLKRHHNWLSNANFGKQIVGMQTVASISHASIAMQTVVHSYANRRRKLMWQRSTSEDNSSLLDSKWICDISMMLIYGNSTTSKIRHGTYCTQFWCAKLRFMRQCVYSPVCI